MSKTIQLEDGVYADLEKIRVKNETRSQVVDRLIRVYKTLSSVADTLGPRHPIVAGTVYGERLKKEANARADSPEMPDVPTG